MRGVITLPHGTGQQVKVAVFASDAYMSQALESGEILPSARLPPGLASPDLRPPHPRCWMLQARIWWAGRI